MLPIYVIDPPGWLHIVHMICNNYALKKKKLSHNHTKCASLSSCTVDTSLSFESQTLQIHHDELLGAIQDPVGLSRLLCTNGVLTQPVFGDMDQISTKEKNSLILNAVEARVINVPQVYHVFVDTLRKDSALRTSSVTRMTNTCEHSLNQ